MTQAAVQTNADQDAPKTGQKLTLSGYGFTIEVNGSDKPLILDAEGNPVIDINQRMAAQEKLVLPLVETFGKSWQQELTELRQATAKINGMSTALHSAFAFSANDNDQAEPKIGDVMGNGTVYAGISSTTGTKMYAMPEDSGIMTWNKAIKFTQELKDQYGFDGSKQATAKALKDATKDDGGWRLPTRDELNQLYTNKDDIGKFDSSDPWYWSSSEYYSNFAYGQSFSVGVQYHYDKDHDSSVRCVRSEPRPKP